MKDKLGGYPCDITKSGGTVTILFHHGRNNSKVKHPETIKFHLELDADDIKNLKKILS